MSDLIQPQTSRPRPQLATDQTLEYLKGVEPDDILELLFPRLVLEQQSRLASSAGELAQIDRRLAHLYAMRDDVVNITDPNKGSGASNF